MSEGRGGTTAFLHQCGVLSAGVLFKKSMFTWAVYAFTAIVWGQTALLVLPLIPPIRETGLRQKYNTAAARGKLMGIT